MSGMRTLLLLPPAGRDLYDRQAIIRRVITRSIFAVAFLSIIGLANSLQSQGSAANHTGANGNSQAMTVELQVSGQ
jgi:hypothetical protein